MAREGTRSQTGNSKPRVFPVVDTAPVRKTNTTASKPKTTSTAAAKGAKPVGITKKKAAKAKKEPTVATKAKAVGKKAETKAAGAVKAGKKTKPKTAKAKAAATA
ncbi:hypothetical protein CTRI78_v006560 [Colletotrichum trifolii]|uniref:Uncharacterized protein n=1 Tax=Colletotrichum trifolii TaxID=5466 RepID=A0A4R8RC62_COLTR|nr:hypothetical protein CTRI78_v006560 [Colletotrichum trifolii]